MNNLKTIPQLFQILWRHYIAKMPQARKAIKIVEKQGDIFINDHVAFRTFGLEGLGIATLEQIFLNLGYKKMDYMNFADKKLNAYWYYPPDLTQPKVFISEIRVAELSTSAQEIIRRYTHDIKTPITNLNFEKPEAMAPLLSSAARPWPVPTYADYQTLAKESEYASWTLAYGNELNHFTISVNFLKKIKGLQALNDLLEANGIKLNDAGGKIKGTPAELLMQSSTVADQVDYAFADGTHCIPYSYLEFAERFPIRASTPLREYATAGQAQHSAPSTIPYSDYYQGFVPGNADKIFESTYQAQAKKLNSSN